MIRKMIRKIISVSAALLLTATSVCAQGLVNYSINYSNNEVKIYGETDSALPGRYVSVSVLKPGVTASELPQNFENNYLEYQNIIDLDIETKSFELPTTLKPLETDEKPYTLMVNLDGVFNSKEVYAYSKDAISAVTEEINSAAELTDEQKKELFDKAIRYYAANNTTAYINYYGKLEESKADMANVFFGERGEGFTIDETAENPYVNIRNAIEKSILCGAYNKKLTDGQLVQSELMGFTDDTYSMDIYNNKVSEEGKKVIVNNISGKNPEEIQKAFYIGAVYAAIAYPKDMGYRQIMTLINDEKTRNALVEYGFKYDVYNASDKDKVCAELYKNMPSDLNAVAQALNNLSANNKANRPGSGSGSGSGSGGGGGSSRPSSSAGSTIVSGGKTDTIEKSEIFSDLDKVTWAKNSIMSLYAKGIVSGMGDGLFEPMECVTREQFVKMLVAALKIDIENAECKFDDVDTEQWYYPYVAAAYQKQIVFGTDENSFGIGTNITREQMAAMCARVMTVSSDRTVENFADDADISDYAKESVMLMKKMGIINGDENGNFNPKAYATRAEAAQIIYGILCI